jgi:enterochelin esterase-like enzyme
MRRNKLFLTLFLVTPVLLLGVVLLAIRYSRPAMNAPPVGAGAGNTGGANAIGEYLAGNNAPVTPPPAPTPEPPKEQPKPKPVERPIEPARTTYPRGTLSKLQVSSPQGDGSVEIEVFTPPGYDNPGLASQTYPVLYLIGQSAFSPDGLALDDAASQLISRGNMDPVIIVALPPSGANRPEQRKAYADWLIMKGSPSISNAYRTARGRTSTGIGGVGQDAWTALAAATYHADSLGVLLFLEPRGSAPPVEEFQPPQRVVLADAQGSVDGRDALNAIEPMLRGAGLGPGRLMTMMSGSNDGAGTRQRLEHALAFLFPPPVDGTK